LPTRLPFVLFRRQREFIEFLSACLEAQTSGLCEKARDMGATWLCAAFSVWLWLY
jgi:phage terminase large subunit